MWSLIRSDRSPVEDRRPIEGLTSKPRPNSEPSIFTLFSSSADRAPTARTEVLSDFHYINSYLSRAASSDAQLPSYSKIWLFAPPACACLVSH